MSSRNRKVAKYRKPIRINIGIIIFMIIFVYILAYTITYLNKPKISIYEVVEKKIADNNICKGIILRDETVFYTESAGYLNFYLRNGERAYKNSLIYTIDKTGQYFNSLAEDNQEIKLTNADINDIRAEINSFKTAFDNNSFYEVYNFKYDIENVVFNLTSGNISDLDAVQNGGSFTTVRTEKSGIVSYYYDTMESLKAEDVTAEMIRDKTEYNNKALRAEQVESKAPAYKLITSENWSVILNLTQEQYDKIQEMDRIKITFVKDNLTTYADLVTYTQGENYMAKLSLDRYMIRYINDRFLDVELSINSAEGLKIPVSAVDEKDFLKVPLEYFTEGGDSDKKGLIKEVYKENGEVLHSFVPTDIYLEEDGMGYIDANNPDIKLGDSILLSGSSKKYELTKSGKLQGVYNVNNGYSVFRRIEIIYGNTEYYIVKKETKFGLNVYDNIVLDKDTVIEQSIIH